MTVHAITCPRCNSADYHVQLIGDEALITECSNCGASLLFAVRFVEDFARIPLTPRCADLEVLS